MVYVITLGFAPHRIWTPSLFSYGMGKTVVARHLFLDQNYPLDKDANSAELKSICDALGIEYLNAGRNLGLHEGFNYVLRSIDLKPDDVVIALDPDSMCEVAGWDEALCDALKIPDVGWATLMNPRCEDELKKYGYDVGVTLGGKEVWFTRQAIVNSICAWRGDFLIHSKGLTENRPFYGHLESPMYEKLKAAKLRWAFLVGYPETDQQRLIEDRIYQIYKWEHAHLQSWHGDFESWLAAGSPRSEEDDPAKLP